MICALCGGTGGARLARGINAVYDPAKTTYICNVGDNIRLFDLTVCPDIDTIIYYLSGAADYNRGWGLSSESFNFLERLRLFYPHAWFGLGDRDLATHVWRSSLLRTGQALSEVTQQEAHLHAISARVLPATDSWVETTVETLIGTQHHYEEYFIRLQCDPLIKRVYYTGIEDAAPAPGVIEAIESAHIILLGPSNPVASILPIVSIPGIRESLTRNREKVWAITPILVANEIPAGEQLRARSRERLLATLGFSHTPDSIGYLYQDFCSHIVLDERDFVYASALEGLGYEVYLLQADILTYQRQVDFARQFLQLIDGINIVSV